jgi:hypothetical protein
MRQKSQVKLKLIIRHEQLFASPDPKFFQSNDFPKPFILWEIEYLRSAGGQIGQNLKNRGRCRIIPADIDDTYGMS